MKKLLLASLVLVLVGIYAGRDLLRNAKGMSPSTFGMQQIADNVFVDVDMDSSTRRRFLSATDSARDLAQDAFSTLLASPTIIGCSTEACFRAFGEKHPKAVSYYHWWILVSPRGLNSFIIAHELAHTELHKRLGLYRTFFRYPHWRDEGMAVWVSKDPRYLDSSGMKPGFEFQADETNFEKEWLRLMGENSSLAYPFACWAFLEWRKRNPSFSALWENVQ